MNDNKYDFSASNEAGSANPYNNAANNFTPVNIDLSSYTDASNANGSNTASVPVNDAPAEDNRTYKGVHPIAAGFHIGFKLGALLTFILGNVLSSNFVLIFIITVLFCAADFWVTKNVTGRILVALRWWNQVNEDGSSQWVFESGQDDKNKINSYDNWFFWAVLGVYTAAWALMCILNILKPTYLPLAIIGLVLAGSNLLGYIKCSKDARGQVTDFMMKKAMENPQMVTSAATNVFSMGKGATTNN